jgi:phage terminase small subunit
MSEPRPLTPKQQRFVEEYLIDLNATAAYKRAGYVGTGRAAENAASRLLGNVGVKAAIQAKRQVISEKTEVTIERVIKELSRIAFCDIRKLYRPDGTFKPITELDDDSAATLAGVEVFEEFAGRGDSRELIGHVRKVKRWDKLSALVKLGEHQGMFVKKVEVSGKDGGPVPITVINVVQPVAATEPESPPSEQIVIHVPVSTTPGE